MSDNASERYEMTDVTHADTAEEFRDITITAGDQQPGETIERTLWKAARLLGLNYQRVRSIYHRSARRIEAHELLNARRKASELRTRRFQQQIATLEARNRTDAHALAVEARQLFGPAFEVLVKAGLVVDPEAADGET